MKRLSSILAPLFFATAALFCWHTSLAGAHPTSQAAALEIRLDAPATADAGIPFTYTLVVSNTGNGIASDVVVTNTVPAGATHLSGGSLAGTDVTWSVGPISAGNQISVSYAVTATDTVTNDTYVARSTNGATAVGNQPVTTLVRAPDLSITKVGPSTAQPLAPITYTLTVTNSGSLTATNLLITDVLPLNATYLSGGNLNGNEVQWQHAALPPGEIVTVTFAVTATESVTNSAYAVTADYGFSATGSDAIRTDPAAPQLAIVKTGPATTSANRPVTYTLTISNSGTFTATNLVVTDTLPGGATYVSGGSFNGTVVSWNIAELAPSGAVTTTFAVTTSQTVTNDDYAVTSAGGYGAVGTLPVVTLFEAPDLSITKSGPAVADFLAPITYTLTVTNGGTFTATSLLITDTLPAGAAYLGGGAFDGTTVSWSVPQLAPGTAVTTTFAVTASATITNSDYGVSAGAGQGATGSKAVRTEVPRPALSIGKEGPATAAGAAPITYTLTVTNSGAFTATNLRITDTVPAGATYVDGGAFDGAIVRWNVPELGPATTTQLSFVVTATSTITNSDYGVVADGGIMAAGTQIVVTVIEPEIEYLIYLPLVLDIPPPGEENDTCDTAFPIPLNSTRQFYAEDVFDWYTFELATQRDLEVRLTNFAPVVGQIVLYYAASGSCGGLQVVANNGDQSSTKIIDAGLQPSGTYFVLVINDGPQNTGVPYNLRINAN